MGKISFGTDGWRGIIAEDFTFEALRKVSVAVAAYLLAEGLQNRGILIGYDTRFMAERFAAAVAKEMLGKGVKVFLCSEATPIPVVAYGVKTLGTGGAVMLTASHNPPEYLGFKFIPEYAGPAMPEVTDRITAFLTSIDEDRPPLCSYEPETVCLRSSYRKHLENLIDFKKIAEAKLRFAVDPMHGAGNGYLEEILAGLGLDVVGIRNWRDPLFGGSMPEPKEELLGELISRVTEEKRDLGLALDGDGDRFGVVDRLGRYITPNQVIALLFRYLVEERGMRGPVARTVATTTLIDRMAEGFGLEVIETPVGFKYQGQAMIKQGAILAGEESGGLSVRGHVPEKDGILACLLMAEVTAHYGKPLSQVLTDIYAIYGQVFSQRLDFSCSKAKKEEIISRLNQWKPSEIGGTAVSAVSLTDGWRYKLANGSWLLVRASGTEPMFRIYGEAESRTGLAESQEFLIDYLGLADNS